jgi:predicted permease
MGIRRLLARIRNRRFDEDLAEELRFHEEMKRRTLEAAGARPEDASWQARRALGNVTLMREASRGVWIAPWLESIAQDVRYGVRTLVRQPTHTITAGLALVLAIGLNTSLFTVFKGLALDPWPARAPGRLVLVSARNESRTVGPSVDEYRFMREHARSFSGLVAYTWPGNGARLRAPGRPEEYFHPVWASANFFDVLGIRMQLGSGFIPEDDLPGNRRAPLVISSAMWRGYFGADAAIVGQPAYVSGKPFTVVGVLEEDFYGIGRPVDFWMPLSAISSADSHRIAWEPSPKSAVCCIGMAGRLAPGVRVSQAREELQLLHERFSTSMSPAPTGSGRNSTGRVDIYGTAPISGPGAARFELLALFGAAVLLILVLACANVGNVQLARGLARRREIATRLSIGASRRRVVRQLLTEGLVLACAAGALGIAIAAVLPSLLFRLLDEEIPGYMIDPDWQVVLFTLVICVFACVVFGLLPAFHATRVAIPMGAMDRASTKPSRFHLRSVLLGTQIAVSTVLLVGAALATRAVVHALAFDPGFDADGIHIVATSLPTEGFTAKQRQAFSGQLLGELERSTTDPIALATFAPFNSAPYVMSMMLPGERPADSRSVRLRPVSSRYFELLGIPLTRGRMFDSQAPNEAVVNESFARTYWHGADPLGQTVHDISSRTLAIVRSYTVVGVVRDAYLTGLDRIEPVIFPPGTSGSFLTRGGPAAVERIRAAALGLNAAASVTSRPLTDELGRYLEESRIGAAFAWALGLLGLTLAAVGVFGVFAYAVEERRREIGVRLALGAAGRQIIRMLVSTSGRAMAIGFAAGLLLSLACGPVLRRYLFGLSPLDPQAYGLVGALLLGAALVATFIPARRACRVDPAVTLREE